MCCNGFSAKAVIHLLARQRLVYTEIRTRLFTAQWNITLVSPMVVTTIGLILTIVDKTGIPALVFIPKQAVKQSHSSRLLC